jgi:hypothetical protein
MGSSRFPAVLPANLQGIWNKDLKAPWNSDFHTNINLQMNYWPAEVCNLSETAVILSDFVKRLTVWCNYGGQCTAQAAGRASSDRSVWKNRRGGWCMGSDTDQRAMDDIYII